MASCRNQCQCQCRPHRRLQHGVTLIELMIAMTLGLLLVLGVTSLFVATKTSYILQDETIRLNETGRLVTDHIARSVRQSTYRNQDPDEGMVLADSDVDGGIRGLDAASLKSDTEALDGAGSSSVNGSDVLAVKFFGVGDTDGDGSMVNCAGFSVGASAPAVKGKDTRTWSIFYVAKDATGEPELRCKYRGKSGWTSDAIARGVESFQVLYGLDVDGDGLPNRFVTATVINALDGASSSASASSSSGYSVDTGQRTANGATGAVGGAAAAAAVSTTWNNVVEVRVGLLIRSGQDVASSGSPKAFALFGPDYRDEHAAGDPGTLITDKHFSPTVKSRLRKIFRFSIQLPPAIAGKHS